MTPQRPSTSMLDALKSLSVEPGSDSNELFAAVSIASARFEQSGAKLLRIARLPSRSPSQESSAISPTSGTT